MPFIIPKTVKRMVKPSPPRYTYPIGISDELKDLFKVLGFKARLDWDPYTPMSRARLWAWGEPDYDEGTPEFEVLDTAVLVGLAKVMAEALRHQK